MKAEIPGQAGWDEKENEYRPPADNNLITASCRGDQHAFEEIYRRYRPHVWDLCQRMVGDPAWAEDLTQETFIRAYRRLAQFEQGRALWPWLAAVARNICLDEMRVMQRRPLAGEKDESETPEEHTSDCTSEEAIARHERARLRVRVSAALATLHPSDRRVVLLRAVEGWTYKDIARHDGRSVHAVRNVAWRARGLLRALLNDDRRHLSGLGILPSFLGGVKSALLRRLKDRVAQTFNREPTGAASLTMSEHAVLIFIGIMSISSSLLTLGNTGIPSTQERAYGQVGRVPTETRQLKSVSRPFSVRQDSAESYPRQQPQANGKTFTMPPLTLEIETGKPRERRLIPEKSKVDVGYGFINPVNGRSEYVGVAADLPCRDEDDRGMLFTSDRPIEGYC